MSHDSQTSLLKQNANISKWYIHISSDQWSRFLAYQYKQNKIQLLAILPLGIFFYCFYYFPTKQFAPDITQVDLYSRLFLLATFLPISLFVFFKKKNLEMNDMVINFFSTLACTIWLYLLDSSERFDTPSFILSTSVFIFTCCAVTKTRLRYALISTLLILSMSVFFMLRHYDEFIYTFYQTVFLYLPIVAFACIFCWQNLYIAKSQYLKKVAFSKERKVLSKQNRALSHQAFTDKLTGIRNRRCFERDFKVLLENIIGDVQLCVFVIDLDFFKAYNDNYGHLKGDKCLELIAQTIRKLLHHLTLQKTKLYRVGGEEFYVVHRYQDTSSAINLAEAMLNAVSTLNIEHLYRDDTRKNVTLSIGGCFYNPNIHSSLTDVIQQADKNLFVAKESGKNQLFIS